MSPESGTDVTSPRVLIVCGSPREGGDSDLLAQRIARKIESMLLDAEIVRLGELDYTSCVGCESCRDSGECVRFTDGMTSLYEKTCKARGLVLISPVHNYNVSAWTKAFIDRLYCFYELEYPRPGPWSSRLSGQNRKAVVIAVAEQPDLGDTGIILEAMRKPLEALGYEVLEEVLALGAFDKGAVSQRPEVLGATENAAATLARSIVRQVVDSDVPDPRFHTDGAARVALS